MKRKITVITGTRSEYGLLCPVMRAIEIHPKLQLSIIATGMHLSLDHGYTIDEIKKDGFIIDATVDMLMGGDTGAHMAKSLGIGIIGITDALEKIRPDILLVLGDRDEPFAAAVAAAHMNIPVAHIHGGEITEGCIDESIRHSITKFAHIHFPATEESADRIRKMGEEPCRVYTVGAPGLDTILNTKFIPADQLVKKYSLWQDEPLLLVIQHPVTLQPEKAEEQIRITLEALKELEIQTVLVYPNSDAGGRSMIEAIKEYEHLPFLHTFKSLPHIEFISLMNLAKNIGIRQEGRQHTTNLINVQHDKQKIIEAIKTALYDETFKKNISNCVNPYGDGKAGIRIADVLAKIEINQKLLQKKITY
jgi:UDP-N-acetylglucosamine 2-epimerase (non-hydrolysing)/GDP/UDP-N,N'-diacetylbacillosamine 2-epimerase (hydrolysing)